MQRFTFSLERVLRFQRHLEKKAELRRQQALRAWQAAQEEAVSLRKQLESLTVAGMLQQQGTLNLSTWLAALRGAEVLQREINQAEARVQEKSRHHLEAVEQYRKQAQAVETLEHLRRRRWQAHRQEAARLEQIMLDDVGLRRWLNDAAAGMEEP